MKTSKVERSSLLSLSLLVGACSAADAAPDFEPATSEPAPSTQQEETASSDVLAQEAPDASTPPAATCPNGKGTIRSGRVSIKVGSENRSYIVYVPPGYNGSKPVPLLVDLHPLLTNASFEQSNSGFQAIAAREGFIIAYPEGTQQGANGRRLLGTGWNIGKCCTASNDEAFVRALVDQVKGQACIDEKRVYAAGFSMGGGMSHYLACNAAEVFAAVAPSSFDLLVESEMPCKPARPLSVVIHRGTSDLIVPFGGGASSPPNGSPGPIHFEGAEGTFKRWAQINGCTGTPTSAAGGGIGTTCRTYSQCKDNVEVTLCVKQGGGHEQGNAPYLWSHISKYSIP